MMHAAMLLAAMTAMTLQSTDFPAGGTIPLASMATDCGGKNRTPSLQWRNVPPGAKSFALIVHDPDAPLAGGFDHWILYDIPATVRELKPGVPVSMQTGIASTGKKAYYGPCPPAGPAHHYVFTLYALDQSRLQLQAPETAAELMNAIDGHILATATLHATAQTH